MIRPTSDRVRETLFNILGQWFEGIEVLDLYAGTGALALEALSRGAGRAVLVDAGREAQQLCLANAQKLGFGPQVEVLGCKAEEGVARLAKAGRQFELVFVDPPYRLHAGTAALTALGEGGVVRVGGRVVVEHEPAEALADQVGPFAKRDERRFGATVVSIFELTPI